MDKNNSHIFEMKSNILYYDIIKSILICKLTIDNKVLWAKKIEDSNLINDVDEDTNNYYVSCETSDAGGQFLAINKKNGTTAWYIPGRSYFQQLFNKYLYIIFIDGKDRFYLIKVDKCNGSKIWDHEVKEDLCEYSFRRNRILLKYSSGYIEKISPQTGVIMN